MWLVDVGVLLLTPPAGALPLQAESYIERDPLPVGGGAYWVHRPVTTEERACSLHFEVRCEDDEPWRHWLPGEPVCVDPTLYPDEDSVWFLLFPPHEEYYYCGWEGRGCCYGKPWRAFGTPAEVGSGWGKWQLVDGSGALVSSFTGVWAVDLSDLVAILDLQEHYAKASAEPACIPRDGHACWTIYETWAQVVDWQKEHCSAPEATQ